MNFFIPIAHFDDEVLACGAMIADLVAKGHKVVVKAYTYSDRAFVGEDNFQKKVESVKNQVFRVASLLGYSPVFPQLEKRDMYLDSKGSLMEELIKDIRIYQPDVVITTHYNDFHTDHRNIALALKEACYQAARKGICGSENVIKEPLLLFGEVDMEGITDIRVDVFYPVNKGLLDVKIKALGNYEGFVNEHPDVSKSIFAADSGRDWVYSLARLRGMFCGVDYAEVFEIGSLRGKLNFLELIQKGIL